MVMMSRRDALLHLGAATSVLLVSDCAVSPVTGQRELILISRDEEVALGRQAHPQILNVYGAYDDAQLQSYVQTMGQQLLQAAPRNFEYTFTLVDDPAVNAFAVPGGFVYFTRGIMAYFNDAAQFAGVMGHEIVHVAARHYAQQYSRAQIAQLGIGLGGIFVDEIRQFGELINLGTQLLFLRYSRGAETEADTYGTEYMLQVGYDGVRLGEFFNTLNRLQAGSSSLPEWASTHPDPGARASRVRNLATEFQRENPERTYIVNRNDYLQRINGMVFGNDPRDGYVENNIFYHPRMQVQFPIPSGWVYANQASEVRMSPRDQSALLIFQSPEGQNPRTVAERFVAANRIRVQQSRAITVGNMNGFHVLGAVASEGQELAISSYFIQSGNTVFAFHGVAPPNRFNTYNPTFQRTVNGFRRITESARLNVSPQRVTVRTVGAAMTLQQALANFGAPSGQHQQHAVLNGMALNDRLAAGTRIKVIA